jgi:hypothetical protein
MLRDELRQNWAGNPRDRCCPTMSGMKTIMDALAQHQQHGLEGFWARHHPCYTRLNRIVSRLE